MFDMIFSKKKVDVCKEWLGNFVLGIFFDFMVQRISYFQFFQNEFILFSMVDNI